jgi:hypothetical protein
MLEFMIDNKFVMFGGRVSQQTVGIPMGTNCAPLLADLFLYSYEAYFIQGLLQKNEKKPFCRKVSFLTAPHCRFRGVGQGMKQTYLYLWYPLFQAQWDHGRVRHVDKILTVRRSPPWTCQTCG